MQKGSEALNHEFRIRLQEEFSRRLRANESYSIRSFANHLGVNSSSLSKILAGKRSLSEEKIRSLCHQIGIEAPRAQTSPQDESPFNQLTVDTFAVISDWYHFAILELTLLKTFRSEIKWIARKLNIESHQALGAVERLKRLGLVEEKNGRLKKSMQFYTNYSEGTTSAALKEFQRQIIKKALYAVDNCPQDAKDITSLTFAGNSRKLKIAKEKLKKFRRDLSAFMEDGEKDTVYQLALQLYPLTNFEN